MLTAGACAFFLIPASSEGVYIYEGKDFDYKLTLKLNENGVYEGIIGMPDEKPYEFNLVNEDALQIVRVKRGINYYIWFVKICDGFLYANTSDLFSSFTGDYTDTNGLSGTVFFDKQRGLTAPMGGFFYGLTGMVVFGILTLIFSVAAKTPGFIIACGGALFLLVAVKYSFTEFNNHVPEGGYILKSDDREDSKLYVFSFDKDEYTVYGRVGTGPCTYVKLGGKVNLIISDESNGYLESMIGDDVNSAKLLYRNNRLVLRYFNALLYPCEIGFKGMGDNAYVSSLGKSSLTVFGLAGAGLLFAGIILTISFGIKKCRIPYGEYKAGNFVYKEGLSPLLFEIFKKNISDNRISIEKSFFVYGGHTYYDAKYRPVKNTLYVKKCSVFADKILYGFTVPDTGLRYIIAFKEGKVMLAAEELGRMLYMLELETAKG